MPQMDFPEQIAHNPIYAIPYFDHDPGKESDTDAQFLSLGWSQWDDEEPSAKIVRHSGQRWSRQSEELPLPRLVDLMTFLATVYAAKDLSVEFETGFFENQSEKLPAKIKSSKACDRFIATLHRDELLRRRLKRLVDLLVDLRERELI